MGTYFLRRFLLIFPTFFGITILVFAITRLVPGGPIEKMIVQAQQQGEGKSTRASTVNLANPLSEDQLAQLREYYGFDKPVFAAYFHWLKAVLQLDLGSSTRYSEPVWDIIKKRLPISTFYGVITMLMTYMICVPLGIAKAVRHGSIFDNLTSILVFIGYAIPSMIVAIILLVVFASRLEWFPLGGFVSDGFESLSPGQKVLDLLRHSALPLAAYMMGSFAFMTMLMKNSLLDNLAADYVRTAMAKGHQFKTAVFKHALQNSLVPIATTFGNNISVILAGSFLIERVFNIDGFGLLGYESVVERDYPIVMGILVLSSILQLLGNILSDLCVAFVDPRVQFK